MFAACRRVFAAASLVPLALLAAPVAAEGLMPAVASCSDASSLPASLSTPLSTILGAAPQCTDGLLYDDGTVENGLRFSGVTFNDLVMRFDLGQTGANFDRFCVCWTRNGGAPDLTFDVVFYTDGGTGGVPGAFFSGFVATSTNIPLFPDSAIYTYDLSGFNIQTPTANVYAGVSWRASASPNVFLCTDENGGGTQPLYFSSNLGASWLDLRTNPGTSAIDALVVRVTPNDRIFTDGFESGNTSAWSEVAGL